MIDLEDARRYVLARSPALPPVMVAIAESLGCVTAEAVTSAEDVPPFANTAVDGYAVQAADTIAAPVELRVVGLLAAGAAPTTPVGAGEAIRIMTGAPIPDGADAISIVETTARDGDDGVLVMAPTSEGAHLRRAGGDLDAGAVVFGPGTLLGPAHLGVLASLGVETVRVVRRARVGVLSTGDEIVESGPLAPGQIRDANRPLLLALVRALAIRPLNWLIIFVVDLFRSLPPLVIIVLLYFGLPSAGWSPSGFMSTWLSLALVLMAFSEEIFWAGITSVHKGQWEAARSTGLSFGQTLIDVVLPQALRLTIAPLTNRTIAITKGALRRALEIPLPAAFLASVGSGASTTNDIEGGARGQE